MRPVANYWNGKKVIDKMDESKPVGFIEALLSSMHLNITFWGYLEKSSNEETPDQTKEQAYCVCVPVGGCLVIHFLHILFYEFSISPKSSPYVCGSILHTWLKWCMIGVCRCAAVAYVHKYLYMICEVFAIWLPSLSSLSCTRLIIAAMHGCFE